MKLSQLDLNLFLVFNVIYSERNLTRAAEVLSVTQPTVSNALARMRSIFADPLFVKTSRGMTPTPFAESLAGRVGEAMALLSASAHARDEFHPANSQRVFCLSMNDWIEALIMPELVQKIDRAAPGVSLRSYRSSRRVIAKELASGGLDLAIDVPLEDTTDLLHRTLHRERYVCALRPGHPFVNKPLSLETYLSLGHINVSGRRRGAGFVDHALRSIGGKRNVKLRVQHYRSAVPVALSSDLALTITEKLARSLGFAVLDLPFDVQPLEFSLYWHRTHDEDPANCWLREAVLALFQGRIAT